MAKEQTLEEIRAGLVADLGELFNLRMEVSSPYGLQQQVVQIMTAGAEPVIQRALRRFDAAIKDKERHLKLGEAADQFIAAMKLPPVEVKK